MEIFNTVLQVLLPRATDTEGEKSCGVPRGIRPPGSFSFAISLWNDKEMGSMLLPNAREALCEALREVVENSVLSPHASHGDTKAQRCIW